MELIQTERIRLTKEEKSILNNAFYILNQIYQKTINSDLSDIADELIDGLAKLEDYYE